MSLLRSRPAGLRVGPVDKPDRYVLGPAVGSGSEGILYKGHITTAGGVDLDVAIKMLQPRFLDRIEEWNERWMLQVELLRSLQVPGVVTVRDGFLGPLPHAVGEKGESQTLYLVMNWVEGEPLDTWIRKRPDRDPIDDLKVLLPIGAALDLMHSGRPTKGVPVVHRDLKPSNILVCADGSVLVDFGLTRELPTGHRLSGIVGTPGYLAPECEVEGLYTPASDRYALGAVAFFVLTGTEIPKSPDKRLIGDQLSDVPAVKAQPGLAERVLAMLDDNPAKRPEGLANWIGQLRNSSIADLPEELSPVAAPLPVPATTPGGNDRSGRSYGRPEVVSVAVYVLIAALSLLAIAVLTGF